MDYTVYHDQVDDRFKVRGLKSERTEEDQVLLHHIPYPETETPEVSDPSGADEMHAALYDMYQWHEKLKEGDKFTTPFGNFKCVSFHVVKDTAG
jgi:hypothetical protein